MVLAIKGKNEAAVAAHREQAWHTYQIVAVQVGKGMPTFEKFCGVPRSNEPERPKSGAELEAIGRRWHAALNARPKRGGPG